MPSRPTHHYKTGKPRHVGHHYLKVYYPYLPLLILVVAASVLVGHSFRLRAARGVLGYATSLSTQDLLAATNQQRQDNGESSLALNDQLSQAAQTKANDMVSRNYWSHNTPDGQPPWVFIDRSGYNYQKAGENLAYGFASSRDTVSGWMNSPPHRANMLDSFYKDVGFGFASASNYQNTGPETVVVAMYGAPFGVAQTFGVNGPISQLTTTAETKSQVLTETSPQPIGAAAILSGGRLPWLGYSLSVLLGIVLTMWVLRHWLGFRKFVRSGERLLITHPLFDVLSMGLVAVVWVLERHVGVIR